MIKLHRMIKKVIRLAVRLRRKFHRAKSKSEKDRLICSKLTKMEVFRRAKKILLYAPIPHEKEVNTWLIIDEWGSTKTLVLPKTLKSKEMKLHIVTSRLDTKPNSLHIPEPLSSCEKIDPKEIDLAIIPGVAFDKKGNRIGFGHGYYDRLLKKLRCPVIALAYDFQILHAVPRHEHDAPVDTIITEKKNYHTS